MSVLYLSDVYKGKLQFKIKLLPWQKRGLQYTATGYGKKIPTNKMVRYNNRWHRVYCHIFSNSGSLYIISGNKRYYLHGYDIPDYESIPDHDNKHNLKPHGDSWKKKCSYENICPFTKMKPVIGSYARVNGINFFGTDCICYKYCNKQWDN